MGKIRLLKNIDVKLISGNILSLRQYKYYPVEKIVKYDNKFDITFANKDKDVAVGVNQDIMEIVDISPEEKKNGPTSEEQVKRDSKTSLFARPRTS